MTNKFMSSLGQILSKRVRENARLFRKDFATWIASNANVYAAFMVEADRVREAGRNHYSARKIWESLRQDSATREAGGEYKLNNDYAPDVARLYMLLHPAAQNFFKTRHSATQARAAA